MDKMIHTPEGVRDVFSEECKRKRMLEQKIEKVFQAYGYQEIETPTFEFFDVFGREVGTTPSRELYKFFDREGNTLVLRPDFTPSIARAVSMYYMEEDLPIRLWYQGSSFVNNSSYQGRLKESTQMGVELLNEDSPMADAELLAMTVRLMLDAGFREFQVSVGHVGYFRALAKEARLSEEGFHQLRELISIKNYFGVEELLERFHLHPDQSRALAEMTQMFGGPEVLQKARTLTRNREALEAVERLEAIYEILKDYGYEKYICFDFGMLSRFQYYTGIIFQAYTYGNGEPLVKGGRYDRLLNYFGKNAPAVGFCQCCSRCWTRWSVRRFPPGCRGRGRCSFIRISWKRWRFRWQRNTEKKGWTWRWFPLDAAGCWTIISHTERGTSLAVSCTSKRRPPCLPLI